MNLSYVTITYNKDIYLYCKKVIEVLFMIMHKLIRYAKPTFLVRQAKVAFRFEQSFMEDAWSLVGFMHACLPMQFSS